MKGDALDPKALIREAFQIEGITQADCRTIFLDWALSLPDDTDTQEALNGLVERYVGDAPDHPMSVVLREGLERMENPRRRGGWRSRTRD
ncbi:hypothetical protein [Sediminimonas qiaohouensis]|uniref:hypothetical protein n=1 Tax=Sediminimonas qiaohouensis TaxID=552061 RepID=UPI0003F7677E|nr:hypothetical protein [Sediminimonas qiaohouensis]